jgi:hypothetical protein
MDDIIVVSIIILAVSLFIIFHKKIIYYKGPSWIRLRKEKEPTPGKIIDSMPGKLCAKCGYRNAINLNFCNSCGKRI